MPPQPLRMLHLRLGDDEWGNELMQQRASAALDAGKADIVHIYEHGGWSLTFAMIDGSMHTIGSANDGACFSPQVKEFWRQANERGVMQIHP